MPSLRKWFIKKSKREENKGKALEIPLLQTENLGKVFKELDCPVCFNTCIPPIHSCINGHIICNTCRSNVRQCPSCRHGFSGTRNFFAENFISNCSQACRYSGQGCDFLRLKGDNMKPHESQCMFRPISCLIPSCTEQVPYKSLLSHLTFNHKICGSDSVPALITFNADQPIINNRKWLPFSIQQYGHVFFVMMEVIRPHFWIWIWLQTTKTEDSYESTFTGRIVIKNVEKKLKIIWEGPVHSVRTTDKFIMKDGLCFVSHEVYMQHFIDNGYFTFEVDIKKIPRRNNVITPEPNELLSQCSAICPSLTNNNNNNSPTALRTSERSLYDSACLRNSILHADSGTEFHPPHDNVGSTTAAATRFSSIVESTEEQNTSFTSDQN